MANEADEMTWLPYPPQRAVEVARKGRGRHFLPISPTENRGEQGRRNRGVSVVPPLAMPSVEERRAPKHQTFIVIIARRHSQHHFELSYMVSSIWGRSKRGWLTICNWIDAAGDTAARNIATGMPGRQMRFVPVKAGAVQAGPVASFL